MAREIYGDIGKLLIVSVGKEKAYEAIDGAIYEEPKLARAMGYSRTNFQPI